MFEIRVICDDTDIPAITQALPDAFTVNNIRHARTFDGNRARLYITAEPKPDTSGMDRTGLWPTPATAYAGAPNIAGEIGWTAHAAATRPRHGIRMSREYWLRKAALLDRIALADALAGTGGGDAADLAHAAAEQLMHNDIQDLYGSAPAHRGPIPPDTSAAETDPLGYLRQEYRAWLRSNT